TKPDTWAGQIAYKRKPAFRRGFVGRECPTHTGQPVNRCPPTDIRLPLTTKGRGRAGPSFRLFTLCPTLAEAAPSLRGFRGVGDCDCKHHGLFPTCFRDVGLSHLLALV